VLAAVPFILLLFAALGQILQGIAGTGPIDTRELFERFLPPHARAPGADPFALVEAILARLTEVGRSLSIVAVPAFIWFSTRVFAGIRTSLNSIYDVSVRPARRHFAVRYLLGKLRDLGMVLLTLLLLFANTALTIGLSLLRSYSASSGARYGPLIQTLEGWVGEVLAFAFLILLFFLLYRHASMRRVTWQAALVAASFMAVAFEVAKRLYALYLQSASGYGTAAADASVGAVILFVVWLYYSALVFLLGGVVAETWELRGMQRVQRGVA